MPNHTGQLLTIRTDKETLKAIKEFVYEDADEPFSSNRINPMPRALKAVHSGFTRDYLGREVRNWYTLRFTEEYIPPPGTPSPLNVPLSPFDSRVLVTLYGSDNCLDWACANWGTKWGIYHAAWLSEDQVSFNTAWGTAIREIEHLSMRFPGVEFELQYADEGGAFVGIATINTGIVTDEDLNWDSESGKDVLRAVGYYYEDDADDYAE